MLHILSIAAMIGIIVYLHLDNLKFFQKLDRISKLSRQGGHSKKISKIAKSL